MVNSNQVTEKSVDNKHYCLTDLSVDSNYITVLVSGEQKHYFHLWESKNHSWPSPLVIFSVPTRENNVFLLSFHRTVILHNLCIPFLQTN
jgi:hypothetical protein